MDSSVGGNTSNNIQLGDAEELDNPDEMNMLEEEEDQDDDPETLEEIERRNDEIVEQFMELALNKKHDQREKLMAGFEEKEDGDEDDLKS